MSMMRANPLQENVAATEIDEEIVDELKADPEEERSKAKVDSSTDEDDEKDQKATNREEIVIFATMTVQKEEESKRNRKKGTYSAEQIADFLYRVPEMMQPVSKAAADVGIAERTAYRYRQQWNQLGTVIRYKSGRKPGTVSQLGDEHRLFLLKLVDDNAGITITAMHDKLLDEFPEITVKKTALYDYVREKCALGFKKKWRS